MRALFPFALLLATASALATTKATPPPKTFSFQGTIYRSLSSLTTGGRGISSLQPAKGETPPRSVRVELGSNVWEFTNGGDRLRDPAGKEEALAHPLLLLSGGLGSGEIGSAELFVAEDVATRMGAAPAPAAPAPAPLATRFFSHDVKDLTPMREKVRLSEEAWAWLSFSPPAPIKLGPKEQLVLRRKVLFDGKSYFVATGTTPPFDTYLIEEKILRAKSRTAEREYGKWDHMRRWFGDEARAGRAFRFGDARTMEKTLAPTTDLCWSLRPMEKKLFDAFNEFAKEAKQPVQPTIFVSGRWIEQHPQEMQTLLEMAERDPVLQWVWGLHSWSHPKSEGFLNRLSATELREDTLRLETLLLRWGIVPTIYYRFPGLVHDPERLMAILELDLFPIDADAWMALQGKPNPNTPGDLLSIFRAPAAGSVALLHGNGNEPEGIAPFVSWLNEHRSWSLVPPARLFP